jgi:hypothetical protein
MKSLLLLAVMALISLRTAQADSLPAIKAANPHASPAEILQKFYETADGPAALTDFDRLGDKSNMKCAGVNPDDAKAGNPVDWYSFKQYDYVVKAGHPAEGPLFPAVPDTVRTVLLSAGAESFLTDDGRAQLQELAGYILMSTTATDLVLSLPKEGDDESDGVPLFRYFRRSGEMIAVKAVDFAGKKNSQVYYAYCWRE